MTYQEKVQLWKNNPNLENSLRKELEAMNEKELEDAFENNQLLVKCICFFEYYYSKMK